MAVKTAHCFTRPSREGCLMTCNNVAVFRPASSRKGPYQFRPPTDRDGRTVHALIGRCPPLDVNSPYANLLQCSHFSDTSVLAEDAEGRLAGFVSAYRLPRTPNTLFVWQVAVDPGRRRQGLSLAMLEALLDRTIPGGILYLETTITPGNIPSRRLFRTLFEKRQVPFSTRLLFGREAHFGGEHDEEVLHRGGPFRVAGPGHLRQEDS